MKFVHPELLWGLSLVLIPIIIHFFNFQRPKTVYFTRVKFLKTVQASSNAKNKLKHKLILLSRILFFAAIILAFAQPFIPAPGNNNLSVNTPTVIYLDNSHSMENIYEERPLLHEGQKLVNEITEMMPKGAQFKLWDATSSTASSVFYNAEKTIEINQTIDYTSKSNSLEQVVNKIKQTRERSGEKQQYHAFVISDFQKTTTGQLPAIGLDSLCKYYFLHLKPSSYSNLYIDSVWLETPFIKNNENSRCFVRVANGGDQLAVEKRISLYIEGKQVGSALVDVAAQSQKTVEISFAVQTSGALACEIQLEDQPVIFDNNFHFTLESSPTIRVVHLSSQENKYLKAVFEHEKFFKYQHFNPASLDYNQLKGNDLIILNDVKNISSAMLINLQQHIIKGGSLLIGLPKELDGTAYNNLLGTDLVMVQDSNQYALSTPNEREPLFDGVFEQQHKNIAMPKAQQLWKWNKSWNTVLQFVSGHDYLAYQRKGKGKIFLMSSPINETYTGLVKHALFVPLMYKMAINSKVFSEQLFYRLNQESILIKADSLKSNDVIAFENEGITIIPEQRRIDEYIQCNLTASDLPAGVYQVVNKRTSKQLGLIALNPPVLESKLTSYTEEALTDWANGNPNIFIYGEQTPKGFGSAFKQEHQANPLWYYFIILALSALLIETVFIIWWKTQLDSKS